MHKTIKMYKRHLDRMFKDIFAIKSDPKNRVVNRINYWRKQLNQKLWYD